MEAERIAEEGGLKYHLLKVIPLEVGELVRDDGVNVGELGASQRVEVGLLYRIVPQGYLQRIMLEKAFYVFSVVGACIVLLVEPSVKELA